jgi:glycosyltransferase involved in cell wall biosynthesis
LDRRGVGPRASAHRRHGRRARAALNAADLTVVTLTRDEAARLPAMLARLPAGVSVFVLDADSTDDTVAIAQAHGAVVERRAWSGFVDARRYALGRVATPWAFMLDADELIDDALRDGILASAGDVDGYRVRRITMLCGKPVRAAGWSNELLLRIVRTDRATIAAGANGADVHEQWSVAGRVADLPGAIVHDSYPTVASYRAKFDFYTSAEARVLRGSPWDVAGAVALLPVRFAWSLLRYGGWLDGWRGLFVAWESARYKVVVRSKALRGA